MGVLGESQHGKSSFINMISGTSSQRVGSGDGKSCTSEPHPVKFSDHLQLFGNSGAEINCDDIPGFGDTGLLITNRQILGRIKSKLAGLERRELDALLVFQSIAESRIELARTFSRIEEMFGPDILRSAIVIITKSDTIVQRQITAKMATITEILAGKNIPYVVWVNDSSDGPAEASQKEEQIASLRSALRQVRPYEMMGMTEYESLVKERAKVLMAQDTSNTMQVTFPVTTQEVEVYRDIEYNRVPRLEQGRWVEVLESRQVEKYRVKNVIKNVVATINKNDFHYYKTKAAKTIGSTTK